ncbi:hypothetical protein BAE44_0009601 [Dichanthelium oligosanthes]|uniref:Uncharacterized protein n=1 Tax=Dichanthelium oligosanthes TaxID=888268 RepID=A0A1E5VW79_9POAL|nr:hypothetical protein BAE44_0009601 [Dichanthelium oligosanthes]
MFLFRRFIHEKQCLLSTTQEPKPLQVEFPTWKSESPVGLVNNLVWFWSVFG